MLTRVSYARRNVVRKNGYRVTVKCYGVYRDFVFMKAQTGDKKGSVTISGPGLRIPLTVGNRLFPVNLSGKGVNDVISQMQNALENRRRLEMEPHELHAMLGEALKPYRYY